MSYDAMAGYVYVLDTDIFENTTPEAYQSFLDALEEHGFNTDTLAYALDTDDFMDLPEDVPEDENPVLDAYQNFVEIFKAKTGLEIELVVIDGQSEYDEVNGPTWAVCNAVEPTAPAKAFEQFIDQRMFATYG